MRVLLLLTALALVAASCTSSGSAATDGSAGDESGELTTSTTAAPTTTTEPPCTNEQRPLDEIDLTTLDALPADPTAASVVVSAALFPCADTVGIVPVVGGTRQDAASWSADAQLPLLLLGEDPAELQAEIARLDAGEVVWLGGPDAVDELSTSLDLPVRLAEPVEEMGVGEMETPPALLVFNTDDAVTAELLRPSLDRSSIAVAAGTPSDLDPFVQTAQTNLLFSEGVDPTTRWQWELRQTGTELPGGGTTVFPDRRMVGFYGSPVTFRLGLLGETGPERAVERVQAMVDSYQLDGTPPVIGMFEIIATVADWKPGDDNDYSNELAPADMREWVEIATANDLFVIIDLQPGRTDFLTQAKLYEEFLVLPNVGLALDPEWRLEPDEKHLVQIGNVDAAEINTVVDYLTDLVRAHSLPQKVLVLHQFQIQMLPDRELVRTPPELAVVVHVDGQGPLGSKYGTYDQMIEHPLGPDQTLWWGWKNFIDEDFPTASPSQTNAVEPLPMVVTFQ